jgi:hypothetical protein
VVHTFSYSTQDSTGKGGFFNFSYAPSIDLEAQYGWTTDTVDVTMRRYGFELGAYTPWLKQKGLGTMWGLRAAFIDKEFEVVNPVFESEISYWGLFLGISGNHPLGQSSPLSVFWTLQGIALMFNWDGKDREYGYDVEGTSGFGLGTNGTVGFQLAFSDSLTATVGYRGQLLTGDDAYNDDFGDTYQAVIAQMALRF